MNLPRIDWNPSRIQRRIQILVVFRSVPQNLPATPVTDLELAEAAVGVVWTIAVTEVQAVLAVFAEAVVEVVFWIIALAEVGAAEAVPGAFVEAAVEVVF